MRRAKATAGSPDSSIHDTRKGMGPVRVSEERLGVEKKKEGLTRHSKVTLKNGAGLMDLGGARCLEDGLRDLLERYPEHFRAFHAIVEGRGEEVSKELQREMKRWGLLRSDGSPNPVFESVMVASYRETPDGPAIVDPVDLSTQDDVTALKRFDEQAEKQHSKGMTQLLRKLIAKDKDEGKGRPS
jgi:hypothetical protein